MACVAMAAATVSSLGEMDVAVTAARLPARRTPEMGITATPVVRTAGREWLWYNSAA